MNRRHVFLAILAATLLLAAPSAAIGAESDLEEETFIRLGGNVALVHDMPGRNMLPNEFGYSSELGHRWKRWGVFGQITHNLWAPNRQGWTIKPGVINVGAGVEFFPFDSRRVRIGAAAGSSTLLFETVLDEAGTTGFFFEVRPVGLRWEISERLRIEWDPITFSLSQPVVEEPTLDQAEFKSVLMLEVGL